MKKKFGAEISTSAGSQEVRGVDIHQYGVGVISSQPFAPGQVVVVRIKGLALMGFAYVRHSTRHGAASYVIGLEFKGEPLRETGTWHFQHVALN